MARSTAREREVAEVGSFGHITRFMKPSHLFGIIVRVIGVLLWVAALWQIYGTILMLAGRTSWDPTFGTVFYQHLLPASGLVAAGFALIRSEWLRRFSYPDESSTQLKPDHMA